MNVEIKPDRFFVLDGGGVVCGRIECVEECSVFFPETCDGLTLEDLRGIADHMEKFESDL